MSCKTDGARCQTDASRASNRPEMAVVSHNEGAGTYLGAGGAKGDVEVTDGVERHVHMSTGHGDVPGIETKAIIPANATQSVRIPRKKTKPPDLPVEAAICAPDEPNGRRDHTDRSSAHTDAQSLGTETETPANEAERVRVHRNRSRMQYSPKACEIATAKPTYQWKWISIDNTDVYVPWNVPVKALGTANRMLVFGKPDSGDEVIAPRYVEEMAEGACNGIGDQDRDDVDRDGMASSGNADLMRVNGVRLAGEAGQHQKTNAEMKKNVPVSSGPPIQRKERPYGDVTHQRRHGRVKPIPRKVSQTHKVKMTYRIRKNVMQPPPNDSKRLNGAIGPRRRRDRVKIKSIKVNNAQRGETTYRGRARIAQPPRNNSKRLHGVHRPRCRRGHIKIRPINISRTPEIENAYLGRVNAIRLNWRPKTDKRRLDKLTFKYRKLGERPRYVEDYR